MLLRIGPWCHGEVRNGGFPNWLQKMGDDKVFELRRDNPGYLGYVMKLYGQISQQTKGLLWKDGGPVIAIQVENEYGGPTQHLMTLKQMARDAGIDVPLYTCTGWGSGGAAPFGEMVPFSGGYVDGFWDRSLRGGGYDGFSIFPDHGAAMRRRWDCSAAMRPLTNRGPETGPGSGQSRDLSLLHLRTRRRHDGELSPARFHAARGHRIAGFGETRFGRKSPRVSICITAAENPEGKTDLLNETQTTNYWNDLPVKNYDFQSPIGEYGQEREHYHWLRLLGLFLQDFGPGLSGMTSHTPNARGSLNWAARSDGESGYLFVSHYQHLSPQPNQENIQFQVKFANGDITLPFAPVTIPYNIRFFWPLNLDLGGVKLISASAQPICQINDKNTRYTVFRQTAAIPAEFVFDAATATVDSATGKTTNENSQIQVRNVQPGLDAAIRLHGKDGEKHVIILLDEATSLDLWKGRMAGSGTSFRDARDFAARWLQFASARGKYRRFFRRDISR